MNSEGGNLGRMGEDMAAQYLRKHGYDILERNYMNKYGRRLGEIDIIARDKKEKQLVFVEVKTREMEKYGGTLPEENITYGKLRKLAKIASSYLYFKRLDDVPYRFDAISVWISQKGRTEIKHIIAL